MHHLNPICFKSLLLFMLEQWHLKSSQRLLFQSVEKADIKGGGGGERNRPFAAGGHVTTPTLNQSAIKK